MAGEVSEASPALLEMRGITRTFPGVKALDRVDFSLRSGEIHALVGENGAGKSTLVKVLTGVHAAEAGEIRFCGARLAVRSPREAQAAGIATIYQEVNLIPHLSVTENLLIGRQPHKGLGLDWRGMHRRARDILRRFNLDLDVRTPVSAYSVAVQQLLCIARALDLSARLLVLDEPTSSLDPREVEALLKGLRRLRSGGMAILFIGHVLDEILALSDRTTVLRNGRRVGTFPTADLDRRILVGHMLGRSLDAVQGLETAPAPGIDSGGTPVLEARGLGRPPAIRPFGLEVRRGEVLGLAGLLGSGRTEAARLLFGADVPTSGEVRVDGKAVRIRTPRRAVKHGLAFCPEDRKVEGLLPGLTVWENIILVVQRRQSRWGRFRRRRLRRMAETFMKRLGIVPPDGNRPVKTLSGGNQQKVILARWLAARPRVLILDEPTRGIDVGAKVEIESLVKELAAGGMAVIFISSALEEVVRDAHTVVVFRDREVVACLRGDKARPDAIFRAMAGGGGNG